MVEIVRLVANSHAAASFHGVFFLYGFLGGGMNFILWGTAASIQIRLLP